MTSDASAAKFTYYFPNPTKTKESLKAVDEFDSSINKAFEHFTPLLSDEYAGMPLVRELSEQLRTLFHELIGVLGDIAKDSERMHNALTPLFWLNAESNVSGSDMAAEIQEFHDNSKAAASSRKEKIENIKCRLLAIRERCPSMQTEIEKQKIDGNKFRDKPKTTQLFVVILAYFTGKPSGDNTTKVEEKQKYLAALSDMDTKVYSIWEVLDTGCAGWWRLLRSRFDQILDDVEWLWQINENPLDLKSEDWLGCRMRLISLKDTAEAFSIILSKALEKAPSFPLLSSLDLDRDPTLSGYLQVFEKHLKGLPVVTAKLKTVEQILHPPHDTNLRRELHQLDRCIHGELKAIQVVFDAWFFHLEQGFPGAISNYREITEMEKMNGTFLDSVEKHKTNIANLSTEKRISRSKSKIVKSKQKHENINGIAAITQATIATEQEVLEELENLGVILTSFETFSTELGLALRNPGSTIAGTPENVRPPKDAYSVDPKLVQRVLSSLNFQIAGLTNAIRLNS